MSTKILAFANHFGIRVQIFKAPPDFFVTFLYMNRYSYLMSKMIHYYRAYVNTIRTDDIRFFVHSMNFLTKYCRHMQASRPWIRSRFHEKPLQIRCAFCIIVFCRKIGSSGRMTCTTERKDVRQRKDGCTAIFAPAPY